MKLGIVEPCGAIHTHKHKKLAVFRLRFGIVGMEAANRMTGKLLFPGFIAFDPGEPALSFSNC
jgi:hypothetical protein